MKQRVHATCAKKVATKKGDIADAMSESAGGVTYLSRMPLFRLLSRLITNDLALAEQAGTVGQGNSQILI